jgi:hypothetical protein
LLKFTDFKNFKRIFLSEIDIIEDEKETAIRSKRTRERSNELLQLLSLTKQNKK